MLHHKYSPGPSPKQKRSSGHISTWDQSSLSPYRSEYQRKHALAPMSKSNDGYSGTPRYTSRLSTSKEATTLEKIWGSLFNEDGQPTTRLGQLLRGVAMHIIEECEPRHSIVITPAKMTWYYRNLKLQNELYPWSAIFDGYLSISRIYKDLKCQHHFVQERNDHKPDIPGLTPVGFERWMTLLIQAHPEEEYRRLQKAVLDMPISNPDNKERFPKDIPRRLFPQIEERGIREQVEYAIVKHADIQLPWNLNRKEPQSDGDTLFHTSRAGKQQCNPPNSDHRNVSFVLPPNTRSDTPQRFDKPTYEDVEKARRQKDGDVLRYRERPRQHKGVSSDDKRRPLRTRQIWPWPWWG